MANKLVLVIASIFDRLGAMVVETGCTRGTMKGTYQKKNAKACRDDVRQRKCLKSNTRLHETSQYSLVQHPRQLWQKMHTGHLQLGCPIL